MYCVCGRPQVIHYHCTVKERHWVKNNRWGKQPLQGHRPSYPMTVCKTIITNCLSLAYEILLDSFFVEIGKLAVICKN